MVVGNCENYIFPLTATGGGGETRPNVLELLYTEGAEITPEDWGNANVQCLRANSTTTSGGGFQYTKCKKATFPDTQIASICLPNNIYLTEYDSGNSMEADSANGGTGTSAFYNCGSLTKIYMGENFLPFGNWAFSFCYNLSEVHYRGTIDHWAEAERNYNYNRSAPFGYRTQSNHFYLDGTTDNEVTRIELQTATLVNGGAFYKFNNVTEAFLGASVASVGSSSFNGCSALNSLVLEGDTVKTLSATSAFASTPIESATGTIWVKAVNGDEASLVAEYKTATNWATYEAIIKPYSEYTGDIEE